MATERKPDAKGKDKRDLTRRPAREFQAGLSKDGKYWLLRDTTTWFIPVNYLEAIRRSCAAKAATDAQPDSASDEGVGGADGRSH